jgi:hypothetical protein
MVVDEDTLDTISSSARTHRITRTLQSFVVTNGHMLAKGIVYGRQLSLRCSSWVSTWLGDNMLAESLLCVLESTFHRDTLMLTFHSSRFPSGAVFLSRAAGNSPELRAHSRS